MSGKGGGPPDISGMTSLKVDCSDPHDVPDKWNIDDLKSLFEKHGEIGDIFIPKDRDSGRLRPFGFVRFFSKKDAEAAIDALDGHKLQGIPLKVAIATKTRDEAFTRIQERKARSPSRGRSRSRSDSRRRRRSPSKKRRQRSDSRSSPPRRRGKDSRSRGRRRR